MIDSASLLKDLKGRLKLLQADLKARADDPTNDWGTRLKEEYNEARNRERTGHSWSVWRDNEVDQTAVAWIISTTFLRFCEDNNLLAGAEIDGKPVAVGWISGPGDSVTRSEENLSAYFVEHPDHNRRHWLQQGFRVLAAQPAGSLLIDPDHNPVWTATISQDAAASLIDFWRTTDANGALVNDFSDPALDTRFLGDLYQDLSDHAKKTYALLQTPVFVEEFILDQTLEPAVKEFGLDGFKMIDPTCGSGHFLLGAFTRLHQKWYAESPSMGRKESVRKAMDSIHGVDLNPFAVAIARFRLTVAGLQAAGETSLVGVAPMGFHLAIGDSLLGEQGGSHAGEFDIFGTHDEPTFEYAGEDLSEYADILTPGQYHAVVGNPPYVTVKDKQLNRKYRAAYATAAGKYQLTAPFMELFFRLTIRGTHGQPAGFTGQITSNGFMKREFGKKLIEDLFAGRHADNPVDLLKVIDTSGAYIPGHGTPTAIIIGRRRHPQADAVRVVLGMRGEPGLPTDPANGMVWREIVENIDNSGYEGTFVSVSNMPRKTLSKHPWSLNGGGAIELYERIGGEGRPLSSRIEAIGYSSITGDDEFLVLPRHIGIRIYSDATAYVIGESIRDYRYTPEFVSMVPVGEYSEEQQLPTDLYQHLWRGRTILSSRMYFGKKPAERGIAWWDYAISFPIRNGAQTKIVYSNIATHNQFSLDRDRAIFNAHGQVIIPTAVEESTAILAALNSSVACFWLKQVSYPKGGDPVGDKGARVSAAGWDDRYEFTGTKIREFPLPAGIIKDRGQVLDSLSNDLQRISPRSVVEQIVKSKGHSLVRTLADSAKEAASLRAKMVFEQEEHDWELYRLYGLIEEDLTYHGPEIDALDRGERAFEITLARLIEKGEEISTWFERHGSTSITELPAEWSNEYKIIVQKRLDLISADRNIRLLEKPEFKRRWVREAWEKQQQIALRDAILDRLEKPALWMDAQGPALRTVSDLAHALSEDLILREMVEVYSGTNHPDLVDVLHLALTESAPYLATYRYKSSGLEKFREWQIVWDLQRREDAGVKVEIPAPPKYSKADFKKDEYWKVRGKYDVPKERFISYPDLSKANDSTPVLGWAGWSYRDQALALARELPGRMALIPESGTDAVVPLMAGLVELEPWLEQWHQEIEPEFGMSPAVMITQVLDTALSGLAMTRDQVTGWAPPAPSRGRASKK